jgi:hypothetical protein
MLNLSSLGDDCGITHNTAKAWLSLLETSFIVFRLLPHHKNFGKRLVKTPKIYFHDTGLLSYLLGIKSPETLTAHAARGPIFETLILSELRKAALHRGQEPNLSYWRARAGLEVDILLETSSGLLPVEIKAGRTLSDDAFKNIRAWRALPGHKPPKAAVVFGGDQSQPRSEALVLSWRDLHRLSGTAHK